MGLLIGEVARRAGLSTSALRYYERVGLLPPPARVSKRRIYDAKVLGRIRIVLLALDAGFTVKETKTFLSGYPLTTTPAERWRALATKKLAEVDAHPHPAELAGVLSMPKPTVTVYVKRLEAAGFLRREIDGADLRRHRLILTPEGRKTMARGLALLLKAFGARLARLNSAEQSELATLLEKLI